MIYPELIIGDSIRLRPVDEEDAEFIVKIRTDENYGRFLHQTDPDIRKQKLWIASQRSRENDYYFIIETPEGMPIGTISLYNIDFTRGEGEMGRWICLRSAIESLESVIRLYDFGFSLPHLETIVTRTLERNTRVVSFHRSFGATLLDRGEMDPVLHERLIKQGIRKPDYDTLRRKNLSVLVKLGGRG